MGDPIAARNMPPNMLGVRVSQEDILLGRRCSCTICPLALALKRLHPPLADQHWEVFATHALLMDGAGYTAQAIARYPLSPEATEFVLAFDRELQAQPHSFKLYRARS